MKSIQPVHTSRISVQPKKLSIGESEELCEIPYQYEQRTVTRFLQMVCQHVPRPAGREAVTDPLMWSVNERMNVIIYYLSAMLDNGPDFTMGEGHLHDYLLAGADYVESVDMEYRGEDMICMPLHGYQAEAIESLVETKVLPKKFISWQYGVMAACVYGRGDDRLVYSDPASYSKALMARILKLKAIDEDEFVAMYDAYFDASQKLQHFVHAVFTENGVYAAQVTEPSTETGVPALGLARFHPRTGISRGALELLGAVEEYQGGFGAALRSGPDELQEHASR